MARLLLMCIALGLLACQQGDSISYNRDIRPIFNQNCLSCHGGIKQSGGFSLLFEEDMYAETESGLAAVVPGHPHRSELVKRIHHHDPEERMPQDKDPLSQEEIQLIEQWISEGAKWETHWAYVPPGTDIQVPEAEPEDGAKNAIDNFIFARLRKEGLSPNPEADKHRLIRRLSLDLTGLPPSQEEAQTFAQDSTEEAYEKAVDRLLASPHFGEKWASMWLDLARYADSKGYEKDLYRSIWKYRDWVIHAFNEDMPFDQFTLEQLAGDLLPIPTEAQLIATAFHRNTMANDEGGTDNEEFRTYAVIERVGTTFEVWQSTTMACVQCHSHPYDPFRQEEFYEFMAFFDNTEDRDIYHEGPNLFTYEGENEQKVEETIEWIQNQLKPEDKLELRGFLHDQKMALLDHVGYRKIEAEHFDESSSFIEAAAPEQNTLFQLQDTSWIRFEQMDLTKVEAISLHYSSPFGAFVEVRLRSQHGPKIGEGYFAQTAQPSTKNRWDYWKTLRVPIGQTEEIQDVFFVFKKDKIPDSDLVRLDWLFFHEKKPLMATYSKAFQSKLADLYDIAAVPTPILQELPPAKRRTTHLFERGNWLTPGEVVTEDIPEALGRISEDETADRLAMAKWLVDPKNPLTARVAVNRFWEQLFGFGMVETVEDFGTQGIPPNHPELLDWLAVEFIQTHQWSMKHLIKQMVMSASYRQSSKMDSLKLERDPRNLLLSRGPRTRLSAEQLRDQVLAVSGLLNPRMYGPSVRPPRPEGAGKFKFGDTYELSPEEDQYRRGLYTYLKRTIPFPNQITFDGTDRTTCTSRRIRTNTPLQALALLNDPVNLEAAREIAQIMYEEKGELAAKLIKGYEQVLLRKPSDKKLAILEQVYWDARRHFQQQLELRQELLSDQNSSSESRAAFVVLANAMLNLDEFVNK
ncbi:MAG: DUF1553 domain-containing protein [Bacteroidota bacterium]